MSEKKVDVQKAAIDGKTYVPVDAVLPPPSGKRAIVVVDRGWIFAGDVEEKNGRIVLTNAVHVRSWSSVGFDGMIANPAANVTLRKLALPVDIPADSEIFRIPVPDSWGL